MKLLQSIGMESVNFQSTTFFKELTNAFAELKAAKKDAADSEVVQQLSAIIKNHTGMSIEIRLGPYNPCIEIPKVDRNHPFIDEFHRNYTNSADGLSLIRKAGGQIRGSVSLKTGKVTGIFTEISTRIHLPKTMFESSKFEPEEIAAVTLHEVGHLFTYFEYITRTVTTNQILAGVSKALDKSGTVEEREAVLISAKEALKLGDLNVKELAKSSDKKVAEVVIVTEVARASHSELGSNIYDTTSWEMLADQYCARYGAYRPLVTALAKIYKGMYHISFRSLPEYMAMEAVKLVLLVGMFHFAAVGWSHVTNGPLGAILGIMIGLDGSGDNTYDRPGARFVRVRNQIVENLKDKNLSKDDVERLKADLDAIDAILKTVSDRRQLLDVAWQSVIPSMRKARTQTHLQQDLESLATNDLFVKAAELRQMA